MHPETVRRIERATGTLGTAAIAAMDERLPWFPGCRRRTVRGSGWWRRLASRLVRRLDQAPGAGPAGGDRGLRHRAPRAGPRRPPAAGGRDGPGDHRRGGEPGSTNSPPRTRRERGRAARGGARLRAGDRVQRRAGVRAQRRGTRRLGRPAGGARRRLPGPGRVPGVTALVGVRAELVVHSCRGDRGHHGRRRSRADHRGDARPGPAGPAGPAGRRPGQAADRRPRRLRRPARRRPRSSPGVSARAR